VKVEAAALCPIDAPVDGDDGDAVMGTAREYRRVRLFGDWDGMGWDGRVGGPLGGP
jgi:hypothetical protein